MLAAMLTASRFASTAESRIMESTACALRILDAPGPSSIRDVGTSELRILDLDQEPLSVDSAAEGLDSFSAGGLAPTGSVGHSAIADTLLDVSHTRRAFGGKTSPWI
jgi:hypothetical protein